MNTNKSRQGFTLVELAIVLVIIGLLVGGVLVGQDLIKAATVRSTVGDIEKVNAAATTFRTKYSGIPGDILSSRASEYGLLTGAGARDGTAGKGDGNNIVEGCAANVSNVIGCETAFFWVDLSTAALIPQRLSTYTGATGPIANQTSSAGMANFLPKQKLRDSAFLSIFPQDGKNNFYLGGATATATTTGVPTTVAAVTGGEARSIDEKFDDAFPTSGVVTSVTALNATTGATLDAGTTQTTSTCMNGTVTPKVYNVIDANINNVNCMLSLRASF